MSKLAVTVDTLVGLAFDVEKSASTKSGFAPAEFHFGSDLPLFGDLRLEGFAAALKLGFAKRLLMPGKDEKRYPGETFLIEGKEQPLWQGWAICQMLEKDYGIDASRLSWITSTGTTANAIEALKNYGDLEENYAVMTSWYHQPRADVWIDELDPPPRRFSAEACILAACTSQEERLIAQERMRKRFAENDYLVKRAVIEIEGISKIIDGGYQSQKKGW